MSNNIHLLTLFVIDFPTVEKDQYWGWPLSICLCTHCSPLRFGTLTGFTRIFPFWFKLWLYTTLYFLNNRNRVNWKYKVISFSPQRPPSADLWPGCACTAPMRLPLNAYVPAQITGKSMDLWLSCVWWFLDPCHLGIRKCLWLPPHFATKLS